ncbi:LemA family protein [Cyanobacterium stanieri PCC 7202]|uniref:LemA family protein n=1 Tax=Cyanobacterium stanieri (strain ATCC 29140 / PCC 7202) TaxID=292563 RepID=K9YH63_CYASC|nr:LemA family protein [Cyanobacterium stanieri PCC 7202]
MSHHEDLIIPDDIADEVLNLAVELYAQKDINGYSLQELKEIGGKVEIPPEVISEALTQVREKHKQEKIAKEKFEEKIQGIKIVSLFMVVLISLWSVFTYNGLNNKQQDVMEAWAQVENQLQRKADLIPTLVSLTQAQTRQEEELILRLENARNDYLQADGIEEKLASTENINEAIQSFNQYIAGNQGFVSSQAFTNLQYEIAGTENRIATERRRYNQLVRQYNQSLQSFPNSLLVRLFNFEEKAFYE